MNEKEVEQDNGGRGTRHTAKCQWLQAVNGTGQTSGAGQCIGPLVSGMGPCTGQ